MQCCFSKSLYTKINMRRCIILHENGVFKSFMLLKLLDYKISLHIMVTLSCDRTSSNSIYNYLLKKLRFSEKSSCKTTSYCHFFRMQGLFLDSGVRVCSCPNSTITGVNLSIEAKVGFVTSQNVLWPIDDNNYPSKELQRKSFT